MSHALVGSILSWFGILGSAITIFSNLQSFLALADWARHLVTHWQELKLAFWSIALGWIDIDVTPVIATTLSAGVFVTAVATGAYLSARASERTTFLSIRLLICIVVFLLVYLPFVPSPFIPGRTSSVVELPLELLLVRSGWSSSSAEFSSIYLIFSITVFAFIAALARKPVAESRLFRLGLNFVLAFVCAFWLLGVQSLLMSGASEEIFAHPLSEAIIDSVFFIGILAVLVVPLNKLIVRLLWITVGVTMLAGLNEISKLGIDISAPKIPI